MIAAISTKIIFIPLREFNTAETGYHRHIIGGGAYWNSETCVLTEMPVEGRALNNHGKVIDRNYLWDIESGVTEIIYCCVGENDLWWQQLCTFNQ